jgi:hypothetical protein
LRLPHVAQALARRLQGVAARIVAGAGSECSTAAVDEEYAAADASDDLPRSAC